MQTEIIKMDYMIITSNKNIKKKNYVIEFYFSCNNKSAMEWQFEISF
jgi:hypothetical protein